MRHHGFSALGLVLLTLALVVSPATAQTVANGPYYATPSWDQTLACATLASCPRFIVLSNFGGEAVLDRETGLVWEQSPWTLTANWFNASIQCSILHSAGGRYGWRLPTIQELTSLKPLPAGHPFSNVQSNAYWSATSAAVDTSTAWAGGPNVGTLRDSKAGPTLYHYWCVRGGSGVDPQ
jgi:hypothetical protein